MLFQGMSKDEKATAVLGALSVDEPRSLRELISRTGMTVPQVHAGIRHLREARGDQCVILTGKGPSAVYKLAENAPEVREYANKRMQEWKTQIRIMRHEMQVACDLLPDGATKRVLRASKALASLFDVLEMHEDQEKEHAEKERQLEKREKALAK